MRLQPHPVFHRDRQWKLFRLAPFHPFRAPMKAKCRPLAIFQRPTGALIVLLLACAIFYILESSVLSEYVQTARWTKETQPGSLTVTTFIFGVPWDTKNVVHNCRMISATRHRFLIFTDNMSAPYCRLCSCRPFVPINCPNPKPGTRSHCEKAAHTVRMVREYGEFVHLDSDLIIVKPFFLDRLYWVSRAHDFLANYDQTGYGKAVKYYNHVNGGFFFMRYVRGANYSDMLPRMYRYKTGNDQGILSGFVFDFYKRWDTLSWKWHCRNVLMMQQDTPVSECYSIHDRREQRQLRAMINYTLLTIPA